MSKTIEVPDIAQYEENDSELAKYTIQSLSSLIRNQVGQLKANDLMIGELINRIDKAIEHLHKRNEQNSSALTNKEKTIISKHELLKLENINNKILEDILRGER